MGSKIEPGRVSSVNGRNEPALHTVSGAVAALKMSCAETTAPSRLVLRGSGRWSGASRKSTTNVSSAMSNRGAPDCPVVHRLFELEPALGQSGESHARLALIGEGDRERFRPVGRRQPLDPLGPLAHAGD